ncbi:dihydropteroate synthase [Muriicola sp. Z0-33]|uniref:dihydropteroate synthase n=1 Tax=Muriicola sp. Z0-33 TaxID=2816957 RepID=UPI0022379353|nr:dihydropteroate synthase [Muriicola sp. Z0-33]MCW5517852.1 dihydropteroate synthase [Muriicola sp. Z0-33]
MTINCKGNLIDLTVPRVMGILNLTPDSFYDGGKYRLKDPILHQTEKMLSEGATFIDLGGYSSRPGAKHITVKEELNRVQPAADLLLETFPDILLSIDTFRSEVARACLEQGAAMINDISAGLLDKKMLRVIAEFGVPYIMMHMKGTPQDMNSNSKYKDLMGELLYYFSERVASARALGIGDIIIDPGLGFAKNIKQNFKVLRQLELFHALDLPLLVGLSRKSMIYKTLNTGPEQALNGTSALHMYALTKGVHILRTHDVKEAIECVTLMKELKAVKD